MNNIIIRAATESDLPELLRLYKVLLGEDIDFEKACETLERINSLENVKLLVAVFDKHIVGTIQITLLIGLGFNCRPYLSIEYLVVDEAYRNRGIGSLLLKQVDEYARETNAAFADLISSGFRTKAHKLGFAVDVVGFRKNYTAEDSV